MATEDKKTVQKVKQKSRTKTDSEFGSAINFNMHEDDMEKLLEIGKWLGNDVLYGTSGKLKYKLFRKTVSDLINIFYINRMLSPQAEDAKMLKALYQEYYKIRNVKKMTPMKQKTHLSALFSPPDILVSDEALKKKQKWQTAHLEGLSDHRLVAYSIAALDRGDD